MQKTKYLIASCVEEDCIYPGALGEPRMVLGGAGLYAYAGIRLFEKNVELICNVEKGHLQKNREWYGRNKVVLEGICECLTDQGVTVITYFPDGTRKDMPSEGLEQKRKRNPSILQIKERCQEALGLYVFRHLDEAYLWETVELSQKYGFRLMWEISADGAVAKNREAIRALCREIAVFSINVQEARCLCAKEGIDGIIRFFQQEGFPLVFLRDGARGAYSILPDQVFFCPSVPGCSVVDATGAGNASSAAVLYGICRGEHPAMAGIRGSIAASYIIGQYGPPLEFTRQMCLQAEEKVAAMYKGRMWRREDGKTV